MMCERVLEDVLNGWVRRLNGGCIRMCVQKYVNKCVSGSIERGVVRGYYVSPTILQTLFQCQRLEVMIVGVLLDM